MEYESYAETLAEVEKLINQMNMEELKQLLEKLKENELKMIKAETIKIKYFTEDIAKLEYIGGNKSNWIDLRSAETIELKAGQFKLIPLGIAIKLPEGYEALVAPRSSTYKNFGIVQTNSIGLIDEPYCGNDDQWYFPALAIRDTVITVNDRICQFRIIEHQPTLTFNEVDKLDGENRGGIGSSGIN